MRRNSRHRDDLVLILMILALAVAVFLFFKAFFDANPDALTVEILAALLGSILTVLITMLLIKRQGSIEQAHEAAVASKTKIFEKKLELFRTFISQYVRAAADGRLTAEELQDLEELALTISLFTRDLPAGNDETADLGEDLCRFVLQLEVLGLQPVIPEDQKEEAGRHLGAGEAGPPLSFLHILRGMKTELGIAQAGLGEHPGRVDPGHEFEWAGRLLDYRDYRLGKAGEEEAVVEEAAAC